MVWMKSLNLHNKILMVLDSITEYYNIEGEAA